MFKILHKCSLLDTEDDTKDYALILGDYKGEPVTKVQCPKCREAMFVMGREFFDSANPASDRMRSLGRPGFIGVGRTD